MAFGGFSKQKVWPEADRLLVAFILLLLDVNLLI